MSLLERLLIAWLTGWLMALPLCLPWILAKFGLFKFWYISPSRIGISFRNVIYIWPFSFYFMIFPVLVFIDNDEYLYNVWNGAAFLGFILGGYIIVRPPRWAKPWWVNYLEDHYAREEINTVFCSAWVIYCQESKGNRRDWHRCMDSEEGILDMVDFARGELEL